ncbi:hypothetical protein IKE84_02320 [Candidatus Saccharibacteria bacterium]|nr:hypothetical protein [Candidatus Saccharibacteria bacterium]
MNDSANHPQNEMQKKIDITARQQDKLVKALVEHDYAVLGHPEIKVTEDERIRFYRMVSTGQIGKSDFANIIASIKGPYELEGSEAVLPKITDDNHEKRILAYMAGLGFDNFEQIKPETIKDFLDKYPNPASFLSAKEDFLEAIKRSNPDAKYQEYVKAMGDFCLDIYGKKEEYYRQIEELKRQAEEWKLDQDAERLTKDYLEKSEISGDGWLQNGQIYMLTPFLLAEVGLMPRFEIEIGGVKIAFSKVFKADVHEAAIAYVKINNTVKVRGYYRSNSQGMWRLLADYVGGNGEIAWYGVGRNEESLTLPLKIQKTLNEISARGLHEISGVNTSFFLAGTAKRFNSKEEYRQLIAENKMNSDYYKEVSAEPILNFGVLSTLKHPPESIDIDGDMAPNFRKQLDHYTMHTDMYGEVTVRQFPSMDDSLRYSMFEVGHGDYMKAWVGGIEVNATITSTGLKSEWVSTGDVCTPLFEYQTMTGGYGVPDGRNDGYESMWEKYLSLMPIVKRYIYTWGES